MPLTDEEKRDCLAYYPFDDGKGDMIVTCLRDKIVTVRTAHKCYNCDQHILLGEQSRMLVEVFDGQIGTFRWCEKCCRIMASFWADPEAAIDAYNSRARLAEEAPDADR